jgi:hypothetical protein
MAVHALELDVAAIKRPFSPFTSTYEHSLWDLDVGTDVLKNSMTFQRSFFLRASRYEMYV